ncbi:MAG: hypothetical protein JRI23_13305 [Deltaproteobacteria bacterium]|nr:hypothetical protein [Deltaproteobacteria bacterium]MBW2532701.1 hypothetical protein [Deltaproteobacteria bacterium]
MSAASRVWLLAAALGAGCTSLLGYGDLEVRDDGQGAATSSGVGGEGAGTTTAGATGGAAGQGGAPTCASPSECPGEDTDCATRVCKSGECGWDFAPEGTLCGVESSGAECNGAGRCLSGAGSTCSAGSECVTGHCADGVCCDLGCGGLCRACSAAKTGGVDGVCADIPLGQDPDDECSSPQFACNGSGSCLPCGYALTPGGGSCPAACDSCESNQTCVFSCSNDYECDNQTYACPPGWHCRLDCLGHYSCNSVTVQCPADHRCGVRCTYGGYACQSLQLNCSTTGPCTLECDDGYACQSADVQCGGNQCAATCGSVDALPQLTCGASCDCQSC